MKKITAVAALSLALLMGCNPVGDSAKVTGKAVLTGTIGVHGVKPCYQLTYIIPGNHTHRACATRDQYNSTKIGDQMPAGVR